MVWSEGRGAPFQLEVVDCTEGEQILVLFPVIAVGEIVDVLNKELRLLVHVPGDVSDNQVNGGIAVTVFLGRDHI